MASLPFRKRLIFINRTKLSLAEVLKQTDDITTFTSVNLLFIKEKNTRLFPKSANAISDTLSQQQRGGFIVAVQEDNPAFTVCGKPTTIY